MTTIAYKDGVLAADAIMCSGGVLIGNAEKITRRDDGALAGGAGDASYVSAFLTWFKDGEQGPPPEAREGEHSFDRAIIIRPTGAIEKTIEVYEPRGRFPVRAVYYAMGSGKESALGAMYAGASAEMAIHAAIAHDPHTGGDVRVLYSASETQYPPLMRVGGVAAA